MASAAPVLEKTHGAPDNFCSITGGYVVRDPGLPTLLGRYVYGDFCNAALRSVDLDDADDRRARSASTSRACRPSARTRAGACSS